MKVETKFDLKDWVCFRIDGGFVKCQVDGIHVRCVGTEPLIVIRYHTTFDGGDDITRAEFTLFETLGECEVEPSP